MESNERKNSLQYYEKMFQNVEKDNIKIDDWLDKFINIIDDCKTPILDLGCGYGNDTLYLMNKGKKVISCDQSSNVIKNIKKNIPDVYDTKHFNMLDGLPFEDNSFQVIIADLCLHYFREKDTFMIINELKRIIVNGGYLIFRVNSINDVNHGAGKGIEIEPHLYSTTDRGLKRFFNKEDILYFFKGFEIEYLNEEIMTRYKLEKRLYRCLAKINKN
jgi:SAM-dependent methyltransferase